MNVEIMRAFVRLRPHDELREKVLELEAKYDEQFEIVFEAILRLIDEPDADR